MDKFKSIDAADTGIRTKIITKTINIKKGINSLGSVGIEVDKIISISGAEWNTCKVKVVISYMGGVKLCKIKVFKRFAKLIKMGGVA
jgi:hypothetical protein